MSRRARRNRSAAFKAKVALAVERANQTWALDVTYIPMARGWVGLVAVRHWYSRQVLAHRVSITMEADFCVEAWNEAVARYGAPEIINTDQGSQYLAFYNARRPHQAHAGCTPDVVDFNALPRPEVAA